MESLSKSSLLGIELALFAVYTSSNFLLLTWGSGIGYVLLILLSSFLGGAIIIDFERSIKLVSIAYLAGCIGLVLLNVLPIMIYGGTTTEMNLIVGVATTSLAKWVIISFPSAIFLCLFGCFLGKAISEDE